MRGALVSGLALALAAAGCATARRADDGTVSHLGPAQRFASPQQLLAAVAALNDGYRTQRAVHQVAIELSTADGRRQRLVCTGVIAVQRPDRFRLTALGTLGVPLFDLLYRRGRVEVLQVAPRLAEQADRLPTVLRSIAQDVRAVYRLEPHPAADRRQLEEGVSADARVPLVELYEHAGDRLVRQLTVYARSVAVARSELGPRTISYGDYERRRGVLLPRTVVIGHEGREPYWVSIRVTRVELDVALDARLFADRGAVTNAGAP